MVLEEVESDWETEQKEQGTAQPAEEATQPKTLGMSLLQALPQMMPHVLAMEDQEDAETQTERLTPRIVNIRKEAEQIAMASLEER